MFEATIGGKFATLNLLEENADNLTENIHGALDDTASQVLSKAKKPRMTNDILDLCDRRRRLNKRRKEGPLAMQNYSQVNQVLRRKMKQAIENWISDRRQEIDCGIRTANSKDGFQHSEITDSSTTN